MSALLLRVCRCFAHLQCHVRASIGTTTCDYTCFRTDAIAFLSRDIVAFFLLQSRTWSLELVKVIITMTFQCLYKRLITAIKHIHHKSAFTPHTTQGRRVHSVQLWSSALETPYQQVLRNQCRNCNLSVRDTGLPMGTYRPFWSSQADMYLSFACSLEVM